MSAFALATVIPEIACDLDLLRAQVEKNHFIQWCPACDCFNYTRVRYNCGHGCCDWCHQDAPGVCSLCLLQPGATDEILGVAVKQ